MKNIPDEIPLPKDAFERQRALIGAYTGGQLPLDRRSRNKSALVAVAATALLAVLLVAPAFGIGSHVWDLIGRPSPPTHSSFRASVEQLHAGKTWSAGLATNALGESCVEMRSPRGQQSATCVPNSKLGELGPIRAYSGGIGDVQFLYGAVAPSVKRLTLVRSDCSTHGLELSSDGVFLRIDHSDISSPYKLKAFDSAGIPISSKVLVGRASSGAC